MLEKGFPKPFFGAQKGRGSTYSSDMVNDHLKQQVMSWWGHLQAAHISLSLLPAIGTTQHFTLLVAKVDNLGPGSEEWAIKDGVPEEQLASYKYHNNWHII